jgi:hypothetical protein
MVSCRNNCCHRTCCQNIHDYELSEYEYQTIYDNNIEYHNINSPNESAFFSKYLIMKKNNLIWLFFFMSLQFSYYIYTFIRFDYFSQQLGLTEKSNETILNHLIYEMILFSIQMILVFLAIVLYPFYRFSLPITVSILLVKFIDIFSPLFYNYNEFFEFDTIYDDDLGTHTKNAYETVIGLSFLIDFLGDLGLTLLFITPTLISISYHIHINFHNHLETKRINYLLIPLVCMVCFFTIVAYGILYQLNYLEGYTISLLTLTLINHLFNLISIEGILFDKVDKFIQKVVNIVKTIIFIVYPFVILGFLIEHNLGFDIANVIQNYFFGTTIYYGLIIAPLLYDFKLRTIEKNRILHTTEVVTYETQIPINQMII